MLLRRTVAVLVSFALAGAAAHAVVEVERPSKSDRRIDPRLASSRMVPLDPGIDTPIAAAARAFVERQGGEWVFSIDPRTQRAERVYGAGIPMLPSRGNRLGPEAGERVPRPSGEVDVERLVPRVLRFLEEAGDLVLPQRGELVFNASRGQSRERGRLISVYFDWHVDGVRVEEATVYARMNSGNVTEFGARWVGPIEIETRPSIDVAAAQRRLLAYSGDDEAIEPVEPPSLLIQNEDGDSEGLVRRLIWRFVYRLPGAIETWEGRVDAHSGEIVGFRDVNQYARAVGGIYARSVTDGVEIQVPFPHAAVVEGASSWTTDSAGGFVYGGGPLSSGLDGLWFDTQCQGCADPAQPLVRVESGSGWLDFGAGGQDQIGNGLSTPADRNTFYHLNQVRRVALKWLPGLPWLATTQFRSNVNINLTCNANFSGNAVNFFRSGGGCSNTGEIADVIQHEWGHGIDINTAGGDMGEGTADVTAMHMSHSAQMGPGFRTTGAPVRNLDRTTNAFGLITYGNYASLCGNGVHCFGQIYGQTAWELAQALIARHGHHTGWRLSERLFFTSLPDAGGTHAFDVHPIYDAYLQADDDDGNLANGTPHAAEIHQVFALHEIAGPALPVTAACVRPDQPVLVVQAHCDRVALSWSPSVGATRYQVLRTELREDSAFLPVAEVLPPLTSVEDVEVAQEVDYGYVILAEDAGGCESTVEQPVSVRLTAQPILSVTLVETDDTPRGNRSLAVDPGEEVDLRLTLSNRSATAAQSVAGTLTAATPGVTVLQSAANWPELPGGGEAVGQGVLRFVTDAETIQCGDLLRFAFVPDEPTGCAAETSYFDVRVGAPDGEDGFGCDPTPACFLEPQFAGLEIAQSGGSCGEIDLSWSAASSYCLNATLSYDVFRSIDPAFVPGPEQRVAVGLGSTGMTDTQLSPGQTYHYVVRAVDSRSGPESNQSHRTALATTVPDLRAPEFLASGTGTGGAGCGQVDLAWTAAAESCSGPVSYHVYRSSDPDFTPGPATLVVSTFDTHLTDLAPSPGAAFSYEVRARDAIGNETDFGWRTTVHAGIVDRPLYATGFEVDAAGWQVVPPDDAITGNWELGDPQATLYQPEDDATVDGTRAWFTGLTAGPSAGSFDVDEGTTTLLSAAYDLTDAVDPVVRYVRWFTNDRGAAPGEDPLLVDVSGDDGMNWVALEEVGAGTPLAWVPVEFALIDRITPGPGTRLRFTASDLGVGSLVEAGVDEFSIVDRAQGCGVCGAPPQSLGIIRVGREGDDIVLDWTDDPAPGSRFIVYRLSGGAFVDALRVGTSEERRFVHRGAVGAVEDFYYRVSAVDACGQESAGFAPP